MAGLYMHIPYCRRKCIYCDFYSGGDRRARWQELADASLAELQSRKSEVCGDFETLYLGGGTPSLCPDSELRRLTAGLRSICGERWNVSEATIELNPDDVTDERVEKWQEAGFNRFSLGVQSLCDEELAAIRRRHDAATAVNAMELLMQTGCDVSVDLMYALPGQSRRSWQHSLDRVAAMQPQHISAYALMYEDGTALSALEKQGKIRRASDGEYIAMYCTLIDTLSAAGYEHYEISNFALPGHHSRHNSSYWQGMPYIGLGPAAHSYDGDRARRANNSDIEGYLASKGICVPHQTEHLDDAMLLDEFLLTRLRMCEGFAVDDFRSRFGKNNTQRLIAEVRKEMPHGGIEMTAEGTVRLTRQGVMTSDSIILDIASVLS